MCPQYKGGWSCFKIHFFIESGLEMIQFKTKSKINIKKYSFNWVRKIQYNYSFNRTWGKSFKIKKKGQKIGLEPSLNDLRWVWDILQGPFLQTKTRIYIQKDYSFFIIQNIH